ncbi:MAG: BMP family ABC transporter substrate-binding protein, partial [Clostridium sp.]
MLALILVGVMVFSMTACGGKPATVESKTAAEGKTIKVGLICSGDENDQGYTYNFIRGKEAATEQLAAEGINVEWMSKFNIGEDSTCEDANVELA